MSDSIQVPADFILPIVTGPAAAYLRGPAAGEYACFNEENMVGDDGLGRDLIGRLCMKFAFQAIELARRIPQTALLVPKNAGAFCLAAAEGHLEAWEQVMADPRCRTGIGPESTRVVIRASVLAYHRMFGVQLPTR